MSRWLIVLVLLAACSAEEPEPENPLNIGDFEVQEIVIGRWGSSAECVEGYGVLHIQLQPELQKQLESAFGWGDASPGKITIYCGRLAGEKKVIEPEKENGSRSWPAGPNWAEGSIVTETASGCTWLGTADKPYIWFHSCDAALHTEEEEKR